MTGLLIGPEQKAAIRSVCALAEANPINIQELRETILTEVGKLAHMARMTAQTIELPLAYLVTYSIEVVHPVGACRHISISLPGAPEDVVPSPAAAWTIAQEFGFVGEVEDCDGAWLEKLKGHGQAVNLVQSIKRAMN